MDKHSKRTAAAPLNPASLPGPIADRPPHGNCQEPRKLDVATLRANPSLLPLVERAVRKMHSGKP